MRGKNLIHCVRYQLGIAPASTQTTQREQELLTRYARDKKSLVEIGVYQGVNTGLMRSVMAEDGAITGIDPFPAGALGICLERLIAYRELARHRRGRAVLLSKLSFEVSPTWTTPIDFLFIDGDHSWDGIDRDWREWSVLVASGGIVALHDSRSVAGRADLDSMKYQQEIISRDPRFREVDAVDSLTIMQRTN